MPAEVPEQVLVTGSLIHGAAAVGVPVTNLGVQDFTETGNVTIADLFRTVPAANVAPGPAAINGGGNQERQIRVNIRGLDEMGPRTLLMVDGVRFPPQADGICAIDPSIIPALALDRVDILVDGASATYGSDAIAGVINIVLKRGFDGAVTMLHTQTPTDGGGGQQYQASQLFGRTWAGGDITLTYEWTDEEPVKGTAHSNYTIDFTPWGLDNRTPIGSSLPGTISTGAPASTNGNGIANVGTVCGNCWAVPHGTGANFNPVNGGVGPIGPSTAATLNWATLTSNVANQGTNEINPLKLGWEEAAQQKNSFVATFDQTLFPGVSFFATGFYANRRVVELLPPVYGQGISNDVKTWTVPTINPYYPTGAPANLRVSYDFGHEIVPREPAYEISWRYEGGFNLDLPFTWTGQLYYSHSFETNSVIENEVSPNSINVALGSVVGGVSKPAALPYLNLFCDPTQFRCNSPQTLAYISAQRTQGDIYQISERGARFDGPLFGLPGGQIKAAVGALYESDDVVGWQGNNTALPANTVASPNPLTIPYDSEPYNVWAEFAQLDIPVFGDNFDLPLVRRLDLEGSFRHDAYHGTLQGSTSNPKLAFTWLIDELVGASVRGSWGTSFRFANAGEYAVGFSDVSGGTNFPGDSQVAIACGSNGAPPAGSAAAALFAAGFACGSTPGGMGWSGAPHPQLRNFVNAATGQPDSREGGTFLPPEKAANYSVGFELAPQFDFLRGLDLQATWYSVKINGRLTGADAITSQTLADPIERYHLILPSDLGCPVAANANPSTCAPFETMVRSVLADKNNTEPASELTQVYWINDGATASTGFLHVEGVDWSASYNWDLGGFGAWNTGITGTYYLHSFLQSVAGGPVIDQFHENITPVGGIAQNGVESAPRMIYRARLGWSDGPYSITGFVNHISHYFASSGVPPNVNFQCTAAGGATAGGTFPCAISNYSNIEPAWYTFDLSFGYNTGDIPANVYLKQLNIQLTVQNLMGKHSSFEYGPSTVSRSVAAYDILKPNTGRVIGITLVKNW